MKSDLHGEIRDLRCRFNKIYNDKILMHINDFEKERRRNFNIMIAIELGIILCWLM